VCEHQVKGSEGKCFVSFIVFPIPAPLPSIPFLSLPMLFTDKPSVQAKMKSMCLSENATVFLMLGLLGILSVLSQPAIFFLIFQILMVYPKFFSNFSWNPTPPTAGGISSIPAPDLYAFFIILFSWFFYLSFQFTRPWFFLKCLISITQCLIKYPVGCSHYMNEWISMKLFVAKDLILSLNKCINLKYRNNELINLPL
jgi:hypothetical protein